MPEKGGRREREKSQGLMKGAHNLYGITYACICVRSVVRLLDS